MGAQSSIGSHPSGIEARSSTMVDHTVKNREKIAEQQVPSNVPSIGELKKSLPPRCFEPSIPLSFYYVFQDLAIVASLYSLMLVLTVGPLSVHWTVKYFAVYPVYWLLQGTMMAAIFCLGHDCGHGSFSKSPLLNDIVGNIVHSMILVPYYPWKLSHHHHHKNTGNIDKDEVFYPIRSKESSSDSTKSSSMSLIALMPGAAWFAYLILGYGYQPRSNSPNHFNPWDPMFARHTIACAVSIACWLTFFTFAVVPYAATFGLAKVAAHYFVPLFVFASWMVIITFLHHNDEKTPWYADEKWDFVRGNLSSIDRHYGWAHDLIHNIGTHQIHHLFIRVPHYRLEEATAVFREKYPHLVRTSKDPIIPSFLKMFKIWNNLRFINEDAMYHTYTE